MTVMAEAGTATALEHTGLARTTALPTSRGQTRCSQRGKRQDPKNCLTGNR